MTRMHRSPSPRRGRGEAGFSLIEITIAIVILTVLSFTTALVLVPVSREHRSARETDIANAAVRSVLESIHATPFNEILTNYPPDDVIDIAELENGQITVSYEDPTADPLVVQLDLTWDSDESGAMSRSFFTVRTE